MAKKKKPIRRNYYKNSGARRRARRMGRFTAAAKAVAGLTMLAAASFAFVFGYDYLTQCDYFEAKGIDVAGNRRLDAAEVIDRARIGTGDNILAVNLHLVRQRLLADPWIAEARVSRELPDRLEIQISEQTPLAILDLGRKFLLNEQGQVFKEMDAEGPMALPLITGLRFSDLRLTDGRRTEGDGSPAFAAVMEVLRLSRRPDTALPLAALGRIEVDRQLGLTLHAFDNEKVIKIGFQDYPDKYDRLRAVMVYLRRDARLPDFSVIDLNHRSRIVVTPAQVNAPEAEHEEV